MDGHVMRRDFSHVTMKTMKMVVNGDGMEKVFVSWVEEEFLWERRYWRNDECRDDPTYKHSQTDYIFV